MIQSTKFQGIREWLVKIKIVLQLKRSKKYKRFLLKNKINAEIRDDGVLYGATNTFHQGAFENLKRFKSNNINSWKDYQKKNQDLTRSKIY